MNESFVPLVPAAAASSHAAFTPIQTSGLASKSASAASKPAGTGPEACGKPVITLQRVGETVRAIRIQCGCGQVVDLNCVY